MKAYARTHTGNYRELNEDNFVVNDEIGLVVVADGMGGHLAGEVASQIAVSTLVEALTSNTSIENPTREYLRQAVVKSNNAVFSAASEDSLKKGMGTTLTCAIFVKDRFVLIAHVGDSRAYLYRENRLSQITRDHSLVGELLVRGLITKQQAMVHPHRNIITRALGTNKNEKIDVCQVVSKPGDIWLFCSDGLSNSLTNEEIEDILSQDAPWNDRADRMLELALENWGQDNITFIIAMPEPDSLGDANSGIMEDVIDDLGKTQEIPVTNRPHVHVGLPRVSEGGDAQC